MYFGSNDILYRWFKSTLCVYTKLSIFNLLTILASPYGFSQTNTFIYLFNAVFRSFVCFVSDPDPNWALNKYKHKHIHISKRSRLDEELDVFFVSLLSSMFTFWSFLPPNISIEALDTRYGCHFIELIWSWNPIHPFN